MNLSQSRKIAPLVILFFVLSTITAPARAILPLLIEGATLLAEGSTAGNALAALTVGSVAGIIYLGSNTTGTGSKAGSVMDIPLGSTSRDRPLDTPPGWTAPASNNVQPAPPSSATQSTIYQVSGYAASGSTPTEACANLLPVVQASNPAWGITSTVLNTSTDCKMYQGATYYGHATIAPAASCPSGYTVSGSSCVLSNAASVMKPPDGRCQILASVNGFVIDPQDPECGDLAAKTGTTVTSTQISTSTPGTGTTSSITINADGSRTITNTRANADGKTSTITTINVMPAANGFNGVISGSSVVVVNGVGSAANKSAPLADIKFPDDYNRENTQQQIKTDLDKIKDQTDLSGQQPVNPGAAATEKAGYDQETKKITDGLLLAPSDYTANQVLNWFSWVPTMPLGSCSPITGAVMGKTISWDICRYVTMINETIGWLLALFSAWTVYGVFFRRSN